MEGVTQLEDFSGAKTVDTTLLPNSISKNIPSPSPAFFLYTLFLTGVYKCNGAHSQPMDFQPLLKALSNAINSTSRSCHRKKFPWYFKHSNFLFFRYMTEHLVWGEKGLFSGSECLQPWIWEVIFLPERGKNHFSQLVLRKRLPFVVIQVASEVKRAKSEPFTQIVKALSLQWLILDDHPPSNLLQLLASWWALCLKV